MTATTGERLCTCRQQAPAAYGVSMYVARALAAVVLSTTVALGDDGSTELTEESEAPGATEKPSDLTRWATGSLGYAERELGFPYGDPLLDNVANQYKGGYLQFDATAGVGRDSDAGAIANGAFDASWELPVCRVLGVSGSGQVGWKESERLVAWTTTGSACLPFPMNTLWGSYTHGENVRLSLFQGVATLRDRQTTDTMNLHVRFLRWGDADDYIELAPADITVDHSEDRVGLGAWTAEFDVWLGTWSGGKGLLGTPRKLSVFGTHVRQISNDATPYTAFAGEFVPLRIDNVGIGEHLAFSAGLGFGFGVGSDSSRITGYTEMGEPMTAELAAWQGLYADGGVAGAFGGWTPSLRYKRSIEPLLDGQLVRDDRVTGTLAYEKGTWSANSEGFIARQRVLRETGGGALTASGGALELAWAPTGSLVVLGRTEAGRTLTAGLASDPIDAKWDLRATLGLQAHLAGRWPKMRR